ncbi:insulin-like growth factor 2 mRNA-binding protein 1 isoform X2 [Styela clava]|uniref:insulin-like growth factor 2 mRNA-binding protein 1 isoform X2 n=1 Tax=Styela clava TaxID=7725 RepID=UPI0019397E49|nr:insulin-like growth factor 2 mRNA-binding protein 1 isoform X2 [Styela clava]
MNKIYLGGLNTDVTAESLTNLFNENSVEATNIVVNKKGFAFADCKDPTSAEKAIEKLNGMTFEGKDISVEHSVPRGSKSKKVQVRNIPSHLNWEELDKLLAEYGTVENCEQVSTESDSATVNVTYSTRAEAQTAIRELNGKTVEGSQLKVSLLPDPNDTSRPPRGNRYPNSGYNGPYNGNGYGNRPKIPEMPTRMLVSSQYVGAIIGKAGATIKQITHDTHARVDVHRKENPGATEKAVTINGTPEACTAAVVKILEIVREEDRNARTAAGTWTEDELPLKLLAHNSLIGRLIGRDGRNLKAIQDKVDTKIAISKDSGRSPMGYFWRKGIWSQSLTDMSIFNAERTITIFGDLKKCESAEQLLMEKLRSCYENDMTSAYQGYGPLQGGAPGGFMGPPQAMYGPPQPYGQMQPSPSSTTENCTLYIPSNSVGAIIGTKGSHIRNVSRIANASIKISPAENGDGDKERRVAIVGTPEGQWKSQFCIFDKLKQEGFFGNEEGRLTSEINIPSSLVGRIIGKGGNNVRELQRLTNSEVVIPRQSETEGMEEVPVKIVGHFFAIQSAQRKVREMMMKVREGDRAGKMRNGVKPRNSYET